MPRKNIRELGGRPLIAFTIDAATRAARLDRVVVSTDDTKIANVARSLGAEVPFLRPAELARNESGMMPVVTHALDELEAEGWSADAVCLLQPTFPFRGEGEVDACIEALDAQNADCVISVHAVPHQYNPHWVFVPKADGLLELATGGQDPIPRRQDLPPAFHRSGSVYVSRVDVIRERDSLYGERVVGVETPVEAACNIDTMDDWARAEAMLEARTAK